MKNKDPHTGPARLLSIANSQNGQNAQNLAEMELKLVASPDHLAEAKHVLHLNDNDFATRIPLTGAVIGEPTTAEWSPMKAIIQHPTAGGTACPPYLIQRSFNTQACSPEDCGCRVGEYVIVRLRNKTNDLGSHSLMAKLARQ